jgi:hypothetical protein
LGGQRLYDGVNVIRVELDQVELFVTDEKATQPIRIQNTGKTPLVIFKFFGPDINLDVPLLKRIT